MPLYRHNNKLLYFAHIPKCGGKSVEEYLGLRFGPAGFLNSRARLMRKGDEWTKTSPGHVLWDDFDLLVPTDWLDLVFAMVRHPVSRIVSAYNFQSTLLATLNPDDDPKDWFVRSLKEKNEKRFYLDHHLEPQVSFLPESAKVFRLEDGFDAVISLLDEFSGSREQTHEIGWANKSKPVSSNTHISVPFPEAVADLVFESYAEDFERFGYAREVPKNLWCFKPIAPKSARRASGMLPGFLRRKTIRSIGGGK